MTAPRRPEADELATKGAAPSPRQAEVRAEGKEQPASSLRVRPTATPASQGRPAPSAPRPPQRTLTELPATGRRATVTFEEEGRVLAVGWPLAAPSASAPPVFLTSARALAFRATVDARLDATGLTEVRVARVEWAADLALVVAPPVSGLAKRVATNSLRLAPAGASFPALNAMAATFVAVGPLEPVTHEVADLATKAAGEVAPGTPIVEPAGSVVGMAVGQQGPRVFVVGASRIRKTLEALGPAGLASLASDAGPPIHQCDTCGAESRVTSAAAVLACGDCGSPFPLVTLPAGVPPELALVRRWVVSAGLSRGLPEVRDGGVVFPHRGQRVLLDVSADGRWLRGRVEVAPLGGRGGTALRALVAENDRPPGTPGVVLVGGSVFVAACEPIAASSSRLREMADQMLDRWDGLVGALTG